MKYSELINFNPIESLIVLTEANDKDKAENLVKTYVMSDDMAEKLKVNVISQLQLDEVVDNKGVLLVGNYGTGKSHLMSMISAVANDASNVDLIQNKKFAEVAKCLGGRFEVIRIELGASKMSMRNVIFSKVKEDFAHRGLVFNYPEEKDIVSNKDVFLDMMNIFATKYPDKGYLIVVDEFLDFLRSKSDHEVMLDLGFMREVGECVKSSKLRAIFGVQEQLFDNPRFSFVSESMGRVKDRFEQILIRKEDTAFVVSERVLKKNTEQKAKIREHLQKFCSLYTNMSERMEEYIELYPIHPAYIDVFNKIYLIENRHILKNISAIIRDKLNEEVPEDAPGIVSFDTYWSFVKENMSLRTDANIKEVVDKSGMLEDIINRSFPKRLYKPLALKIIYAMSVHRLTTGDISIRAGLTAENLRDDLCLYLNGMPDQSSDTLQSIIQTVLKDVMTTVSGQFIEHNAENGQYYLDLKKDIDYDEKITQRASTIDPDSLNNYFFDVLYSCLDWEEKEYVSNFKIYEHNLNWNSHNIFRRGYLFLGTPESRPTAQPPRDYYMYFVPPFGDVEYMDEKKEDEVFFLFKQNDNFQNDLKLFAAAQMQRDLAEEKNKQAYNAKAQSFRKKLAHYLNENKVTCFDVVYKGQTKHLMDIMGSKYKPMNPFKETMDLVASMCFENYFTEVYPELPVFKTLITEKNHADTVRAGYDWFAGRKNVQSTNLLESFNLVIGEKLTVQNSKYAKYFIQLLEQKPAGAVINFSDLYEESIDGYGWIDKHFKISNYLLPVVFLALVSSGNIVLTLSDNTTVNASNLDGIAKITQDKFHEFKYISKPKYIQLSELVRLYEVLDLPVGLINNPSQREDGLDQLLKKASELAGEAVRAKSKLNDEFALWGETLISEHIAELYRKSISKVIDMFSNFAGKYNTVAKLNNFTYSMQEVEQLEVDINTVKIIKQYDTFKATCSSNVAYMTNLECLELGATIKGELENAKDDFRKMRDSIPEDMEGEAIGNDINAILSKVKDKYIDFYYEEHKKRRLGVTDANKKGEVQSSSKLMSLKKLKGLSIFSSAKLDAIEIELAGLKICFDLTPEMLKTIHICPKCNYVLGGNEPVVKGKLEEVEDKIDALSEEWTNSLWNTLSDPIVMEQKKYLNDDQQKQIDKFIKEKKLPEKLDQFFITAVESLLEGFEPIEISANQLINSLEAIGPVDVDNFKKKIDSLIKEYISGKDVEKLRIIVKR